MILALSALLFLAVVALAPQWSASAEVYYVDDGYGGDSNLTKQFTTIQRAINNATFGDTIYIFAGTYGESATVNRTLNIVGDDRNATIIDPPSIGNGFTITANNCNLSSFTVNGASFGIQINSGVLNTNIESVTITNNTRGIFANLAVNVTIQLSYFANHSGSSNAGIYASRSTNVTAKNNTFVNNYYSVYMDRTVTGIVRDSEVSASRYGIYLQSSQFTTVDRNHVGNNSGSQGWGVYANDDHNSTISSNRLDNLTDSCLYVTSSFSLRITGNDLSTCASDFTLLPLSDPLLRYYGHNISTTNLVEGRPLYYLVNTSNVSVPAGAGWVGASNVTNLQIAAPVVTRQISGVWLSRVTNVTLTGLNFTGRQGFSHYGVFIYTSLNVTLIGVNATAQGYGVYATSTPNITIEDGDFRGLPSIFPWQFTGFYLNVANNARVLNSTIMHGTAGLVYNSEYPVIHNNTVDDSYGGFQASSSTYGRMSQNTVTNANQAMTVWGGTIAHFAWDIGSDNTWDGRPFRSYFNATGLTVPTNLSWLLLANVTNVTVPLLAAHNASSTPAVVAFATNVTFSNVSFNGTGTGFYILASQRISILRVRTDNASGSFQIEASSDILITNVTMTNVTYHAMYLYTSSRVTIQNLTYDCPAGCDYFTEQTDSSDTLFFDNWTVRGAASLGYFSYLSGLTFNRIDSDARGFNYAEGWEAFYIWNGSSINVTNSTFNYYANGLYFGDETWNTFVRNVSVLNATRYGVQFGPGSGNVTLDRLRLEGASGNSGITLESIAEPLRLSALNISGFSTGIFADPLSNLSITASQFNNTSMGVYAISITNLTVANNTFRDIYDTAIYLYLTTSGNISNNLITDAANFGINVEDSVGLNIFSNNIQGGSNGLRLAWGRGHAVSSNTINASANVGIVVSNDHLSSTFTSNTVTNGGTGFFLEGVRYMSLASNSMTGNTYNFRIDAWSIEYFYHSVPTTNTVDGKPIYFLVNSSGGVVSNTAGLVVLANATNKLVSGQTISKNWHGIRIFESTQITVQSVTVSMCRYPLHATSLTNSNISGSEFHNGDYGVQLEYTTNVFMRNAVANGSQYGALYVVQARNLLVDNNQFNGSGNGLYLNAVDVSTIANNRITNNSYVGISMDWSSGNVLHNNTLTNNFASFQMSGYSLSHYNHTIPANNTIEGRPIYYRINATGVTAWTNASMVIFANITNGVASDLDLPRVGDGILIFGSRNISIANITVGSGYQGIHTHQSDNITARNVTTNATACCPYQVAYLDYLTSNFTLSDSTIRYAYSIANLYSTTNITFRNLTLGDSLNYTTTGGVWIGGPNDRVRLENNYFEYTYYAVQLYGYGPSDRPTNITLANNTFGWLSYYPIYLYNDYVGTVTVYHNNFNLTYGGPPYGTSYDLYDIVDWSNGFPDGGNFWSNWTSPDDYGGALQNVPGADGIVDTPFLATGGVPDPYPLADPWPPRIRLVSPDNLSAIRPNTTLDFHVPAWFTTVEYSINNGTLNSSSPPHDISTAGWLDGVYRIRWVASNVKVSDDQFFVFAVDTTGPSISVASPPAGGLYELGTELNFTISDPHLAYNATWDPGWGNTSFSTFWNISSWWLYDGYWNITVYAWDTAGNAANATFLYRLDGTEPNVGLNSPALDSVIQPGTVIDLDINDAFFKNASWTRGGPHFNLTSPYDIDTTGWADGTYFVQVWAYDFLGHERFVYGNFTIDGTLPTITLNSPTNNAVIQPGTNLDFTLFDANYDYATYNRGLGPVTFSNPWDISTSGWSDGLTAITVVAYDLAGNSRTSVFNFTIDSLSPTITLNTPGNNSVIQAGTPLDLTVSDVNLQGATWNNGNGSTVFSAPHDISTAGWSDGVTSVTVIATDAAGNSRTRVFVFTMDSTQPSVAMSSPANGSVVATGTTLDFAVSDANLNFVSYDRGFGPVQILSPFDVSTVGWADAVYNVTVYASDAAGNNRTRVFIVTIDGTRPTITLNAPANGSIIRAGTALDFTVADANSFSVTVSNGTGNLAFPSPFDVNTTTWQDGAFTVWVNATDIAGNIRQSFFLFTIDSTPPAITLNSPANSSAFTPGTTIDLAVSDTNLNFVSYDRGSGAVQIFSPFDVSTVGWADAAYNVTVFASDSAGNNRTRVFTFTVDGTRPTITLNTPANNSVIQAGTTLDFAVSDANAFTATWSNGSGNNALSSPFDVSTTGWADGAFTVTLNATDIAGNVRSSFFVFTIDSTLPSITLNNPANNSYIPAGRAIDLTVTDTHLQAVTWNNGSGANALGAPHDVPTAGWPDGAVDITITATDQAGNTRILVLHYVMDSTLPAVALTSPANNSVKVPGTTLDFTITDTNLQGATWNNGLGNVSFSSPHDVSTTGWTDATYSITVTATDLAGNVRSIIVVIATDSVSPSIQLNQPANGTTFGSGTLIDLGITDVHLQNASWSNGSASNALGSPYDIDTTGWVAGTYTVGVNATDLAGNSAGALFTFTIDDSFPAVILVSPSNNSVIQPGTTLDFSVVDNDLNSVVYNLGSGDVTFSPPYDISTTGFSDGLVNVTVTATDNSSHTVVVLFRFTIDSVAPTVVLGSQTNGSVIAGGTTVDIAIADLNPVSAQYHTDGTFLTLPAPYDISSSGWADGTVTITVRATDAAGNERTEVFGFTVDSTPPSISLTSPANNSVVVAGTTLDLAVSDVHSFTAFWDNGAGSNPLTSPFDISTTGWADGAYDVLVSANDIVGNPATRSYRITIDSTAPSITLSSPSNNSFISAGTTVDIEVVELHLTNATWNNGSTNFALATPFDISTAAWPDGLTTVTVNATDAAGNTRSVFFRFTFDSTAPAVSLVSPANNSFFPAGTTLDFAVSDTNLATVTRNNGTGAVTITSPFDVSTASWSDGPVDVEIVAVDLAGNSRTLLFHFTIDSAPPTIDLDSPANNSFLTAGTTVALTVADNNLNTVTRDNGTGAVALAAPYDISTTSWPDGATTITVVATDLAGNVRTAVFLFTFDSTVPSVTLLSPSNNSYIPAGTTIDFAVSDDNLASVTRNNGSGAISLAAPFDVSTAGWSDGSVDLQVIATDLAGNTRSLVFHFTMDSTPPTIVLDAPANNSFITAGTAIALTVTDNNPNTVTRNNGTGAVTLASPFDIATSGWPDGLTDVTVVATDLAGNTRTVVHRFTFDSTPPSITLTAPANNSLVRAGTTLDFAVSDPNFASATWNNGSGSVALSAPFDVTTTAWGDGSTDVTIFAFDVAGNGASAVFHFTFDTTPPSIALTAPANNSIISAGTVLDFAITDLNGVASATRNNGSGPAPLSSPYDVSTVGWADGAFDVIINATDAAGNFRTVSFHFTLDSTPPTVTLLAPSNNSVVQAGAILDMSVTDLNGLASVTWNNGSGALVLASPFDVNTSGWADAAFAVTVLATDLAGNLRTAVFFVTIDSTAPVISLTSPSNNSVFVAGTTIDIEIVELSLVSATYNNSTGPVSFSSPFNINTTGWPDGAFNLVVLALDAAGNNASRLFRFTIDSTAANITLVSPANNSVIAAGTVLDFAIIEANLNNATWNNGSGPQSLASPFDVVTAGWADGAVTVTLTVTDLAGNSRSASFLFTMDSTLPSVALVYPANNSAITPGTDLDFDILDVNLNTVTWNNGSGANPLTSPFDVPTLGWSDGVKDVVITATDFAGNARVLSFRFTIDGTLPAVTLVSPLNNSIVTAGTVVDLTVFDVNLVSTTYQNGSGPYVLPSPWNISTTGWADGIVDVTIIATDAAGNARTSVYRFTFDSTPPTVTLVSPSNNSYLRSGGLLDILVNDLTSLTVTWDNGGGPNTLPSPYDVNTTGWADGSTFVTIIAQDAVGLRTTRIFHFTFDIILPAVSLLSPANNSVVRPGFQINISISDANLDTTSWDNGGGATSFATLYNISTTSWLDGTYNITVEALDLAGNLRTRVFRITIDSGLPTLTLVTPLNNSYIVAGTVINLTISDANLNSATWNDGSGDNSFTVLWNISTAGYADGHWNFTVAAVDFAGNARIRVFHFILDSTLPTLTLLNPANNSYFVAGASITFTIADTNLDTATWDDGTGPQAFAAQWSISTSGWADASKNLTVVVTDLAGNTRTRVFHFTIDSTLPTVTLVSPNSDTHFVAGAIINFAISDVNLNAASWDDGTGARAFVAQWQIDTTGWADGSYNLSVTATDHAGNVRTRSYRWWVDSTPPVITLAATSPADNSFFDKTVTATVQFDIVEAHLFNANWSNGGANTTFAAPFVITVSGWADGAYDITVRATDRAGTTRSLLYHITLDSVAPTINDTSWEGTYFGNGTLLNGTLYDANLLWATTQVNSLTPFNGSFFNYTATTAGLPEGTNSLRVTAVDRAGHISQRTFIFYIDSEAPVFDLQSFTIANNSFVQDGTAFSFQVDDLYLLPVTWRRAPTGATMVANGTGPVKSINTTGWVDGVWTITLTAPDRAARVSVLTWVIVVDSTAPRLPTFAALPANRSIDEDVNWTLDASNATDNGNPLPDTAFQWVFSARMGPQLVQNLEGPVVVNMWDAPGDYEFTLTITDLAGNAVDRTYGVHINDTTAPLASLTVASLVDEDTPVVLDGSATSDNDFTFLRNDPTCANGVYTISGPGGPIDVVTLVGGTPTPSDCLKHSYTFAEPGTYTVTLDLADKDGNPASASATVVVRDRTPPVISSVTLPAVVNEGANVSFDASGATDNDLANQSSITFTWVIRSAGSTVATLTGATAFRVFPTPGQFVVNLTARDVSGNAATVEFPLRVNDIPAFIGTIPQTVKVGETLQVDVRVADTDTTDTHSVVVFSPTGPLVTVVGGVPRITWSPTTYGRYTLEFNISDGFSSILVNGSILVELQPSGTNLPPRFTSSALQTLQAGVQYQYDANAVDPENQAMYYDLEAGPAGMSIDTVTGAVTWAHGLSPTTTTQTFTVNISVWDGLNFAYQEYTLQLRAIPSQPPVIDAAFAPIGSVNVGESESQNLGTFISDPDAEDTIGTLQITVESSNPGALTASLSGTGAGMNLILNGVSSGNATITIRVTDRAGQTDSQEYRIRVVAPTTSPPPTGGGLDLIPLLALGAAGAGIGGFFLITRSKKRKEEARTQAAAAEAVAVAAPAVAGAAVTLSPESAAPAAALAVAAAPAEKKITYTIEGLFVIYKDGRMLYSKTDLGQQKFEDPELVSSMFTAVQSFIKDSFSSEGELNKMGYGDNQIIIERGRSVFTAAIVYGEPDQEFHDQMKAAIETIELSYAGVIEEWDGMMDHFSDIEPKLQGILSLTAGITRREVALATTKQEVQMLSELEFFQGFVRLKCGIKNNTPSVITKATVDIEYNEDVLRLARVEPAAYRTSGAKVLLGVLNPGEKSSVAYYFDPQICTESQIDGVCRYRDASGVLHTVAMKTRKAEVVCPLFFTKEHANTAMLKRLVEQELGEKDSKVFEIQKIPPYIKHKDVFDMIKSVVNAHDVQMVREFTKFNPFHGEAWFYGETKVKGYKIVIRATVIEETNAIEFFAASTNMKAITGLLAEFNHTLNSMVIEKYSDLKIAQIFDNEAKAEIEKKSLMSNMSSAELEGAETDQAASGESAAAEAPPAEAPPSEPAPEAAPDEKPAKDVDLGAEEKKDGDGGASG